MRSIYSKQRGAFAEARLDFNENTIGPSPLVIQSLREISREEISIYPEYSGLKEKVVEAEKKAVSTVENKAEGLEEKAKSAMNQEVEKTKEKVENTVSNKGKQKPIKRSPGSLLTL